MVWNKHTDDLIMYVDLGNARLNAVALGKQKKFIQMFSRSIEVWSMKLANFSTKSVTTTQLLLIIGKL